MSRAVDLDARTVACELQPAVRQRAEEIEAARRLPPDLAATMAHAGLFRMAVPRVLGGVESDPAEVLETIELLAEADGATGWCLMIGATTGLLAAYLPTEVAREVYGTDPNVVTGGVIAPRGRARQVDGGYVVSGRWPFASGAQHCAWLWGGCVVEGDGGKPPRLLLFPTADVELLDTWKVSGLCGTGSLDMQVSEVFVPSGREVALGVDRPRVDGPLYRVPVFGLLALGVAAVALGIARAAVDELVTMAGGKTPTGSRKTLAERSVVQADVARAEAALRAARAFFYDAVAQGAGDVDQRIALRLAATHATRTAATVVDAMYEAGGGTSIYATSPLQRHFRDVHVVTQHVVVAPATWELTGRLLLGLPTDTAQL